MISLMEIGRMKPSEIVYWTDELIQKAQSFKIENGSSPGRLNLFRTSQLLAFYVSNFSFLAGNQLWLINEGLFFDITVLTVPQFRCCGVTNHTDWFEVYNATRVPDSCCLEYSDNCGLDNPGTWWTAVSSCNDSKGGNLNAIPVFEGLATPFF